ncbi:MAG: aldehyde dehydrogenase family protein, partial [Cyanobacteria bacterium REEB65]|nr:aldehyde dehydrogenase family protein [Cyanobacteria bacterium REEB65]
MRQYLHHIDGQFLPSASGDTFDDLDPATGKVVAHVAQGDREDVDRAVLAAHRALAGPWGRLPQADRLDLLRRVADRIMERFEDFVRTEIADTGKPASQTRTLDVPRGAANFRIFADLARGLANESFTTPT